MNVPHQIQNARALRKPSELPDNAPNAYLTDETRAWLDTLKVFEVDGQNLWQADFPDTDRFYILWDFTTNLAWLADSSGYNYPRYVININPWRPEEFLSRPENMPESISLIAKMLENEGGEEDEKEEKDHKVTEMTSSVSLGTAPVSPKKNRKKDRGIIVQSAELIGNLLSEANEPENLEKNKFEVVCLDASGREVSTKSFSTEEAAQEHIDKKNEKLDDDEVGCSYEIRVVGKEYKDPFAMKESLAHDGAHHGDIVRLSGYLRRPGYWRVDTQDALGASQERPWVENIDSGTGFYIDSSDVDDLEVVISSDEFNTVAIQSSDDVEEMLNGEDWDE